MKRKVLLLVVLVLIMGTKMNLVFAEDSYESEDSITMITADLDTGEMSDLEINNSSNPAILDAPAYSIEKDNNLLRAVIPPDERVRVPDMIMGNIPYSCIGVVFVTYYDGSSAYGTGFLYSPNDVATAGHVLYNDNNSIAKSVTFYPAVNGSIIPHTGYTGRTLAVPKEFMDTRELDFDWGTFQLDADIGNSIGYLGWTTTVNVTNTVQITGYPGDKPEYEMWLAGKQVQSVSDHNISYDVDTESGQSGAPVYMGSLKQVVAIHSRGNSSMNNGKKVDQELANVFNYGRVN